jgi:hypothetical protein
MNVWSWVHVSEFNISGADRPDSGTDGLDGRVPRRGVSDKIANRCRASTMLSDVVAACSSHRSIKRNALLSVDVSRAYGGEGMALG